MLALASSSLALADERSVPDPTELATQMQAPSITIEVRDSAARIESEDARADFSGVTVWFPDGRVARGVRVSLADVNRLDDLYLDYEQLAQLRDELSDNNAWFDRNEACEAQYQCVHGVARCRPSQPVRQAFCPGFYTTPDGERGVILSTLRGAFRFPSVSPAEFAAAAEAAINEGQAMRGRGSTHDE